MVPTYIIKRNTLAYQQQPGQFSLSSIISAFGSVFSGGKANLPAPTNLNNPLSDSAVTFTDVMKLTYPGRDKNKNSVTDTLYASMVSFNIASNSKNRIVVIPSDHTNINAVDYNFGNYETTLVTLGIGVGVNYNPFADLKFAKFDAHWGLAGRHPRQPDNDDFTKFYLLAHYYVRRPQLPISHWNLSLVTGTNLSNTNPLQDLLFGFRYGYERFGITLAGNYMVYDDKARGISGFLGVDYQL